MSAKKTKTKLQHPQDDLLRTDRLPHIWCSGCGIGTIFSCIITAIKKSNHPLDNIAMVSGIGCTGRMAGYIKLDSYHTTHGRALPFATGLKLAKPDSCVIVASGDGDLFSIGGNHFIHACRRNMDMTYIVMDNEVYGMTKGQPSPTTEPDWESKFAPHGTGIRTFNPLGVALASGASFIARGFAGDPNGLTKLIIEAIEHKGFSLVEIKSPCVTFRPDEKEWSKTMRKMNMVPTDDVLEAAGKIHGSDGLDTGIFYQATLPVFEPHSTKEKTVADFEKEFEV